MTADGAASLMPGTSGQVRPPATWPGNGKCPAGSSSLGSSSLNPGSPAVPSPVSGPIPGRISDASENKPFSQAGSALTGDASGRASRRTSANTMARNRRVLIPLRAKNACRLIVLPFQMVGPGQPALRFQCLIGCKWVRRKLRNGQSAQPPYRRAKRLSPPPHPPSPPPRPPWRHSLYGCPAQG